MKPRQFNPALTKAARAVLAACILGLVLMPFGYMVFGALDDFSQAFAMLTLPPLLTGMSFLLLRLVLAQGWPRRGVLAWLGELLSWLVVVAFLVIISGFFLHTGLARLGLLCTTFLTVSLLCLPLVLLRQTAVRQRLEAVPDAWAISLALVLLMVTGGLMGLYLLRPPAFL